MKAHGTSPHFGSGLATTAAESTVGWRCRMSSTSMEEMFSPPEMITSFERSLMRTYPSGSITARSPVWNQPPGESLLRGGGVLQVALHRDVAAEHDLADSLPIWWHPLHRVRVEDRHRLLRRTGNALARVQPSALGQRQGRPFLVFRAHRRRAIGFGQAIHVGDVEADALHALDDGSRGSGARYEAVDRKSI